MKECRLAHKSSSKFFSIILRGKSELELFAHRLSTGTGNKNRTLRKSNKNVDLILNQTWQYPSSPLTLFFHVSLRALPSHFFHWQEAFEHLPFVWKTWYLNGKAHLGGKKLTPSLPSPKSRKFMYHLFRTISARLFPRSRQSPRWRIQGMNLYHSKLSVTWQLFHSLRHW